MTLNSEGLEKALPCVFCQGEIFLGEVQRPDGIGGWKKSGYRASCRSCEMSMKEAKSEAEAIAAWNRRALPPVDGLEVVAWKMPGAKVTLGKAGWAFMTRHENPEDYEPGQYEALQAEIAAAIPLVALSQASSVIAGLKEERDEARRSLRTVQNAAKTLSTCRDTELEHLRQNAKYDHQLRAEHESLMERDAQMTEMLLAAEARISSLEEENKRLREALTPSSSTKAAYMGEFSIAIERHINEDEEVDDEAEGVPDPYEHVTVPWTTIKEIMAAIRAYAQTEEHNG